MSNSVEDTESSSVSEEEDEDAKELTEEVEKQFLKTLSSLKQKDPKIYDSSVTFFSDEPAKENVKSSKKKKESLTVREYERKLLLERGPDFEEQEDELNIRESSSPTYIEEQKALKDNFKKILAASDSDDDSDDLLKIKVKNKEEKEVEEQSFKKWLKGQAPDIDDKETKQDLQYLHDLWTDPKLDKTEEYLKDYILNKRYLEKEDSEKLTELNENLSEEEEDIRKADEFEYKYNFRFEEPDKEFLKRYPRDIETSLRRKKTKQEKRKLQREKAKERKLQKFQEKQNEVTKLKKEKQEEFLKQIQKIKELTGNDKLAFEDTLMNDFEPENFDQNMRQLFNDDFYKEEENEKPVFEEDNFDYSYYENEAIDPEDPNFVMDCDYDPNLVKKEKLEKKLKLKNKNKKKLASSDPNDLPDDVMKSNVEAFEKYIDEFYKHDFEDLIDDIPCRFKYNKVVPNSYGLTIDEILAADDDELEKWCSIKKVDQIRSDHAEKNAAKVYQERARDEALKRKYLPSLYNYKDADEFDSKPTNSKKKKKKKKKSDSTEPGISAEANVDNDEQESCEPSEEVNVNEDEVIQNSAETENLDSKKSKKRKKKHEIETEKEEVTSTNEQVDEEMLRASEEENSPISKHKKKKRKKDSSIHEKIETDPGNNVEDSRESMTEIDVSDLCPKKKNENLETEDLASAHKNRNSNSSTGKTHVSDSNFKKNRKNNFSENNHKVFNGSLGISKDQNNACSSTFEKKKKKSKAERNSKVFNSGKDKPFKFSHEQKKSKWQNSNHKKLEIVNDPLGLSDARLQAYGINPKKYKNRLIYGSK